MWIQGQQKAKRSLDLFLKADKYLRRPDGSINAVPGNSASEEFAGESVDNFTATGSTSSEFPDIIFGVLKKIIAG